MERDPRKLVSNRRYRAMVARRLSRREQIDVDVDSVILEALRQMDRAEKRGVRFHVWEATFAVTLDRKAFDAMRRCIAERKRAGKIRLYAASRPQSVPDGLGHLELVEECREALKGHSARVNRVFTRVVMEGWTLAEAAREVGCSTAQACNDCKAARKAVQSRLRELE